MGEIISIPFKQITREARLQIPRPDAPCSRCRKTFYLDELNSLPEVEAYARQLASSMMKKGPLPDPVDENDLTHRYGYGFKTHWVDQNPDQAYIRLKSTINTFTNRPRPRSPQMRHRSGRVL